MQGIIIWYSIFGIWILIGIVTMQFSFRLDFKEIKGASLFRKIIWWYGIFFAVLIIFVVCMSFVFYMVQQLIKG